VETDRAHVTNETRSDREVSTLLEPTGSAKARKTKNELAENVEEEARKEGKIWRELRALARNRIC
jgi:hypothetical protein